MSILRETDPSIPGAKKPFPGSSRPCRKWTHALIVALGLFALYLATAPRAIALQDDGDFVLSGWLLGISHPPGYPLYTLVLAQCSQLEWRPVRDVFCHILTIERATSSIASNERAANRGGFPRKISISGLQLEENHTKHPQDQKSWPRYCFKLSGKSKRRTR